MLLSLIFLFARFKNIKFDLADGFKATRSVFTTRCETILNLIWFLVSIILDLILSCDPRHLIYFFIFNFFFNFNPSRSTEYYIAKFVRTHASFLLRDLVWVPDLLLPLPRLSLLSFVEISQLVNFSISFRSKIPYCLLADGVSFKP